MEIRRLHGEDGFFFEVKRQGKATYYFKDVKQMANGSTFFSVSINGKNWKEGVKAPGGFLLVKNPLSIISDNRMVTQNDRGEWAVINASGKEIIPYGRYAKIDGFECQLAKVKKINTAIFWENNTEEYFNTFGIVDIYGREVLPTIYEEVYKFYGKRYYDSS